VQRGVELDQQARAFPKRGREVAATRPRGFPAVLGAFVRAAQFSILSEIARRADDPPTMRELADAMIMDRSTLGQNLRPLERVQLVAWKTCDTDHRRKLVALTEKGRAKQTQARSLWHAAQERFERTVGATEAASLRDILLGIAANSDLTTPG
jgi:DNA-binding MarR family transcriptional regulator